MGEDGLSQPPTREEAARPGWCGVEEPCGDIAFPSQLLPRSVLHTLVSGRFTNLATVTLAFKGETKAYSKAK